MLVILPGCAVQWPCTQALELGCLGLLAVTPGKCEPL